MIGIIKSWGIIAQAIGPLRPRASWQGVRSERGSLAARHLDEAHSVLYCDCPCSRVPFLPGSVSSARFGRQPWRRLVVTVIAFLFTTVAANAIAIVGSNPVSGMTLMTLIIASAIFVGIGLSGTSGIVASMVIGGVVCTALSMAGGFVTDLKIGYWLGSTPKKQEQWKFLGTLVSAATVGGVILVRQQGLRLHRP